MVVLLHETPAGYPRGTHFDLMFEQEGVLLTWAVESLPLAGETVTAEQLADHRLAYLEYEGAISGDRGTVKRIASGSYEVAEESPEKLVFKISANILQGCLTFVRDQAVAQRWRVSLVPG
jgi:hypothetical protein